MRVWFALSITVLATAPIGASSHTNPEACTSDGHPALGVVVLGGEGATFYVDDRNAVFGNGVWVYQESNDVDGLQRGGRSAYVPGHIDSCCDVDLPSGCYAPDRLVS